MADDELRVTTPNNDPLCNASPAGTAIGTHRWSQAADELRFTPVSETCAARQLLFAGQPWVEQA